MGKVLVTDTHLTDIANAIREKTGETTTFKPGEMANAISAISGGGSEDLTTELTAIDTEVTEQETTIEDIIEALKGKAAGGGSSEEPEVELDYITDGLISWWEGEDGFDENGKWNSRVGTDYISVTHFDYSDISRNPPYCSCGAVYNNGGYGMVTHQDYCVQDYTIQVVGYFDGSSNSSGNSMSMLIGMNMGASPMIGIDSSGYTMMVNGTNLRAEKKYKILKKTFNASMNLTIAPPRTTGTSICNHEISVNGGDWYNVKADYNTTHASKGNNMTVLCYYEETYRSCGARVYSIRVYNRKLTVEELQHNYEIDKARFNIEEIEAEAV